MPARNQSNHEWNQPISGISPTITHYLQLAKSEGLTSSDFFYLKDSSSL